MAAYRLPLPPSANNLVRPTGFLRKGAPVQLRGMWRFILKWLLFRLAPTKAAEEFREAAHAKLPIAPIAGPVELYITVTVPSIASDGPNRQKAVEDALNTRLWFDDKQVAEWHGVKRIATSPDQVGVVIEVKPADPLEHRELATRLAKSKVQELANQRAQDELEFQAVEAPTPTDGGNDGDV